MKIVKRILLGLLGLFALLLVIGLFLPSTWHVERSVTVAAPPEAIARWRAALAPPAPPPITTTRGLPWPRTAGARIRPAAPAPPAMTVLRVRRMGVPPLFGGRARLRPPDQGASVPR